jgi:hypothetical protein
VDTATPRPRLSATAKPPTGSKPLEVNSSGGNSGSAAGGLAVPPAQSRNWLMMAGVVALAAGASWGFYYMMRPPRD